MTTDKKTILIIDDEASYREIFSTELGKEGYEVITAENGKTGLALALEKKPDLILLDLGLPDVYGLDVLGEIRKDSWGKNAKVFIMTNVSNNENVAEAIEKQSFVYLVKSDMTTDELVAKVKAKLQE